MDAEAASPGGGAEAEAAAAVARASAAAASSAVDAVLGGGRAALADALTWLGASASEARGLRVACALSFKKP
jgi:hypothetical protein